MKVSRYRTGTPDIVDSVKDVQRRTSKMERTPQLGSAGINQGDLTIQGGTLRAIREIPEEGIISIGSNSEVDGEFGMVLQVQRSDSVEGADPDSPGHVALLVGTIEGPDDGLIIPTVRIFDKSGSLIFADTSIARRGISEPRMPITFWRIDDYMPTTSGSFSGVVQTFWYHYHPHLRIRVVTNNPAGSTSEVRVIDLGTGLVVGAAITGPANSITFGEFTIDRLNCENGDSPNGNNSWLEVQHRRASGAGTVSTLCAEMIGMDLS